jgi:DNA-binding transcriptional regulator YiaG
MSEILDIAHDMAHDLFKTTVQQWEHGQKKPSGRAQRLLDLIDRKGLAALA